MKPTIHAMDNVTETVLEDPRWGRAGLPEIAERAVRQALAVAGVTGSWAVSVLGTDDRRIAGLNAEFRGREGPTNVLSWPARDLAPPQPGKAPRLPEKSTEPWETGLGDIALAWETCQREAREGGIDFADHVAHLVTHGCLHLLGYDHETDADAERMEMLEIEALASLGISDPYLRRAGA
jgi:probable rRNA maturation factor